MDNTQHTIMMTIEKLPADNEGYVSTTQIATKTNINSDQLQEKLNILYENGYLSSIRNIKYQLTQKGFFYIWVFKPLDERLDYHTSIIALQLLWLLILTILLIVLAVIVLFKVW
ncbi:MAG: hypothetical protein J0M11_15895 [Anaerolineae bacterium]|nr:hypothetical protein [Anaerolineae bacterium]